MNKKFTSSFDLSSTQEWMAKIEKDLKGKSISELSKSIGGITLSPFANFSGTSSLLQAQIENDQSAPVAIRIKITDPISGNKELLRLLNQGVNTPIVEIGMEADDKFIQQLFREVNHEYIRTCIDLKGVESVANIGHYTANQGDESVFVLLNSGNEDLFSNSRSVTVKGEDHDDIDQYLSSILSNLNKVLDERIDLKRIVFIVKSHPHFLINVAQTRAFKHLYYNMLKAKNLRLNKEPFIMANWEAPSENENTNLIINSAIAVSSILGGATLLDMPLAGTNKEKIAFYQRMNINAQHLLFMESQMGRYKDPLEGSYFFEDLTNKIVQKSWDRFMETI